MDEFPQLNEGQPVLNTVNVNSTAEGHEALARTLAQISSGAASKAEEVVSDQSNAMYVNSVANIEQLKKTAQMRLLQHPDQAEKISDQNEEAMDIVKQNAFVNKKDRQRLSAYIGGAVDDVALDATRTNVHQRQLEAAFTHYANWPDELKAYQDALLTDHKKADQLKEAMIGSLHSLVSVGAITPEQAGSGLKTMASVVDLAQDHYTMYGNPNATALDYHTVTSNPLNAGQDKTTSPVNESTRWLTDYHNNDLTFQGVRADIYNRMLPNPKAFDQLEPAQRKQAIMEMQGTQMADGMVNSGEPFPSIEHVYNSLDQKHAILNYRDAALRNALGSYINKLKSGNYLDVMAQTPQGDAIMKRFVMNNTAIENAAIDPAKKSQLILQNKNDMVNQSVSYAEGHHIPPQYVQPIPKTDVSQVENSFVLGNDPQAVLSVLGQYNKQNQTYVANAMRNPEQRMVVQAVAFAPDVVKVQDRLDFIAANQKGREYVNSELKEGVKDNDLLTRIATNLSGQLHFVAQSYDFEESQALQNSMLKTTMRYAKYIAQKDNNLSMQSKGFLSSASWKSYVDQASRIYIESFSPMTGTNYVVNPNQLPMPLTKGQLDLLSDYVVNEGYKYLKEGRNDAEYQSAIGRNPLHMVLSPTNQVQAVDGNGKVYFTTPLSERLIPYAQELRKQRIEKLTKEFKERQSENDVRFLDVNTP